VESRLKEHLDSTLLGQINEEVNTISDIQNRSESRHQQDLAELKSMLRSISGKLIDEMTAETTVVTASGIVNTVSSSAQVSDPNALTMFRCWNCGRPSELQYGFACPTCGADNNRPL
jgi:rubrerythrin